MAGEQSGWKVLKVRIKALERRFDDRHRWYKERDKSRSKAVTAAFEASKEAITKAEESQKQYNVTHNDLTRKMDNQYAQMYPRSEAQAEHERTQGQFKELKTEAGDLRETRSQTVGHAQGVSATMVILLVLGGFIVTFIAAIVSAVIGGMMAHFWK